MSHFQIGELDEEGNMSGYVSDGKSEDEQFNFEPHVVVTYNAKGFRTQGGKARPVPE